MDFYFYASFCDILKGKLCGGLTKTNFLDVHLLKQPEKITNKFNKSRLSRAKFSFSFSSAENQYFSSKQFVLKKAD